MSFDREAHARWRAVYHPCENGVHIFQPEGEFGGETVKNFPGVTLDVFRRLSSAGEGDDWDLLCDLMEDGSCIDDVPIRRQDLELIERELAEATHDPL